MTEVGVAKGVAGGGVVLVQGKQNNRGGEDRVSQAIYLVDQYGNPLASAGTASHVASDGITVTATASKILEAMTAGHERLRLHIGIESADGPLYFFFGAGTGKLKKHCLGPYFLASVPEWSLVGVPQGEVWALVDGSSAVLHPFEVTS